LSVKKTDLCAQRNLHSSPSAAQPQRSKPANARAWLPSAASRSCPSPRLPLPRVTHWCASPRPPQSVAYRWRCLQIRCSDSVGMHRQTRAVADLLVWAAVHGPLFSSQRGSVAAASLLRFRTVTHSSIPFYQFKCGLWLFSVFGLGSL
jgi:hypothetical protein